MNRILAALIVIAISTLSLPGYALADNTPNCDALDRSSNDGFDVDTNLDFEHGDLVFREADVERMVITRKHELFLDGKQVELDARGQELVTEYYVTFEHFIDDVADIAGDAAGLGVSAAIEAIAAIFGGEKELDEFEQRIEARTHEIESRADSMCARLRVIEDIELEMQNVVPGFEPRLFAQQ